MTTALLRVDAAGPLTSIQDRGRPGWLRLGITASGPVDAMAFEAAVTAARCPNPVAVELGGGGITVTCKAGTVGFALCGPGFTATVDGTALGSWSVATLEAGSRLVVRSGTGNWGYLAFAGQLQAARWLGSAATHSALGLGGGRLVPGRALIVEGAASLPRRLLPAPAPATPIQRVRAVAGPQQRYFPAEALAMLGDQPFQTTAKMDRMGLVLDGPPLVPLRLDMPSEPIVFGNLQVDGDGRATLLLADHQPTGGYPRIATLLRPDAIRVAQLAPGSPFRIDLVTADSAVAAARTEAARMSAWLAEITDDEPLESRLASRNLITARLDDED